MTEPATSSQPTRSTVARITAAVETPYTRHPEDVTTTDLLADAFFDALGTAGVRPEDVDGIGVSSFTLRPDHAVDLCWRLGLTVRWLMEDTNGGASALNLLQHAVHAVEAGDARTVVLLAGDCFSRESFADLVNEYNRATVQWLAPLPHEGPNTLFALLTTAHMRRYGLSREDYGRLVLAQRRWAGLNPHAVYRQPLSMREYLEAPVVAEPLVRFDCVPVVAGANALVLTSRAAAPGPGVRVRALEACHNHDQQEGDGLRTGLAVAAPTLWERAALGPTDVDTASIYDDYPVMVYVQLADLGYAPDGDVARLVAEFGEPAGLPVNTSGGQLSAGQAGAAGGMHGLVEVARQLLGQAGDRQVDEARIGLVTGYGMVAYRYGACSNVAVLERV